MWSPEEIFWDCFNVAAGHRHNSVVCVADWILWDMSFKCAHRNIPVENVFIYHTKVIQYISFPCLCWWIKCEIAFYEIFEWSLILRKNNNRVSFIGNIQSVPLDDFVLFCCGCTNSHWGRVTHICVGNLTIFGPDNGLSPGRRQAIIWTNAGILLIGPWGTNFSEIVIGIHTFSFKKIHLKMPSAKWHPFCRPQCVDRFPYS